MELREYLEIIKAKKNIIIWTALFFLMAAVLFSVVQKPIYRSNTAIEYRGSDSASSFMDQASIPFQLSQPERLMSTQAMLIKSEPLAKEVISKLKLDMIPEELLKNVSVNVGEDTNLIDIAVEDENPNRAEDIANAITATFIQNSNKVAAEEITNAKKEVSFEMRDMLEDIQLLSSMRNEEEVSSNLDAQIGISTNLYTELAGKYQQLNVIEDLTTGGSKIALPASLPKWPVKPDIFKNSFLALFVGIMVGLTWVFSVEYLDKTLKTADEIEKVMGLPVLGQIPVTKIDKDDGTDESMDIKEPTIVELNSRSAESYRSLRTNIQFMNFEDQARVILITSASAGDGKSTISSNLASLLALSGAKVLLIDCDMRNPKIHLSLGIDNLVGLSSMLVESNVLSEVVRPTGMENLSVITSGPKPPNPSELLGSSKMSNLIKVMKEDYDYVIIDTPPACIVTDPTVLSQKVDAVLLIVSMNKTHRDLAEECKKTFENVNARIIGVVANKAEPGGRYGNYSDYYGNYYYGGESRHERQGRKAS